ncbi:uncharacterized protein TNIN_392081 [Trichonephila inaurata madagascariensis]|uniref:Uncharacterized protein n=1 Tax=Trichonephila inaurata madagascariensis TaxID=2747483 RepID=A0A8X7C0I7_9ARAC|nr:uncharacterized protein TNIN_392081 [Trichonephila inaurata madagascariensis]
MFSFFDASTEKRGEPSNIAAGSKSDTPFVISCTNEEGDEDIVETCHVPIGLKKSDPSCYEPRKRFGSFACGPRKFSNTFSTIAHSRTRKSLPLNIKSTEQSETADFRQHLKATYQRTFNKMSRHNSIVPQVSKIFFNYFKVWSIPFCIIVVCGSGLCLYSNDQRM